VELGHHTVSISPPASGFLKAIYPNPATDVLSLEFKGDGISNTTQYELILFSEKSMNEVKRLSSNEILANKSFLMNQKLEMDVRNLPRGVYILHIVPNSKSNFPVQKHRIILK
jgi:NADPH-dependent 7-cyano-7-deazaguanine reductase QueF